MAPRSKGVGAGTDPVASTAHKAEALFSGDEIALGVTCQLQIGDRRSIVVQTHTTQNAEPAELNALFDKIWTALDRVNARYRLKELQLNKKMQQDQMGTVLENNTQTRARMERQWEEESKGGARRRGPFQMNAAQHNVHQQQLAMIERHKAEINALDTEIRETERIIAAG